MQIGDLVVATSRGNGPDRAGIIVAAGRHKDPHTIYWDVLFPEGVECISYWWLKRLEAADAKG